MERSGILLLALRIQLHAGYIYLCYWCVGRTLPPGGHNDRAESAAPTRLIA
jgi:hypothetical protein